MTETERLSCTTATPLLEFLGRRASKRKVRLFIAACCRRIPLAAADRLFRAALDVIERYADGKATAEEVGRTAALAESHAGPLLDPGWFAVAIALDALPDVAAAAGAAGLAAVLGTGVQAVHGEEFEPLLRAERHVQANLVREVMGNPFRPVQPDPAWLTWRDGAIGLLAQAAYDQKATGLLLILADALEAAGCADRGVLTHLRGPGPHVKGCWVLDLLRGAGDPRLLGRARPMLNDPGAADPAFLVGGGPERSGERPGEESGTGERNAEERG